MIGDTFETDIAEAKNVGIDSALVRQVMLGFYVKIMSS